uniref:SAM domain-containing protein n=1 Tax=Biomphalaria glabrata TaxID=6526 RepID=A0A2C9L3V7_BIOGL
MLIDLEEQVKDINSNEDVTNNVESVPTDSTSESIHMAVDQWLPTDFHESYLKAFKDHGYENTSFIKGITAKDLHHIGVKRKGHVQHLLDLISNLPGFEIHYKVPTDVKSWLKEIGLSMYKDTFSRNTIKTLKDMEILKSPHVKEIVDQLGIVKQGTQSNVLVDV